MDCEERCLFTCKLLKWIPLLRQGIEKINHKLKKRSAGEELYFLFAPNCRANNRDL